MGRTGRAHEFKEHWFAALRTAREHLVFQQGHFLGQRVLQVPNTVEASLRHPSSGSQARAGIHDCQFGFISHGSWRCEPYTTIGCYRAERPLPIHFVRGRKTVDFHRFVTYGDNQSCWVLHLKQPMYVSDQITWEQFEQKFREAFCREMTLDEHCWFQAIWTAVNAQKDKSMSAAA